MGHTKKHGLSYTPEYRAWQTARLRCTRPANRAYAGYGGRGITMWPAWQDDPEAFISAVGPRPGPKYEIDRIDNDKGYEPGNCRWVTRRDSCRNRRSTRWVEYGGVRMSMIDLSRTCGVSYAVLQKRIDGGWSVQAAAETPVRHKAKDGHGTARSATQTNACGYRGVKQRRGRYVARRLIDGKRWQSKSYATPEEAHRAYVNAGRPRPCAGT